MAKNDQGGTFRQSMEEDPAAKNDQGGAFRLLKKEHPKLRRILGLVDVSGNRIKNLSLLVKDKLGRFPALDCLHFLLLLLCGAGATSFPESFVLLMVLALIAGSTYWSIFNFNTTYRGLQVFSVVDIVLQPDLLPDEFYSLLFLTHAFTTSVMGVAILLQSVIKKQPYCLRALSLLGLVTVYASYCSIQSEKVPEFWVTTGSIWPLKIPSSCLVWICCQCIVLILTMIWFMGKMILGFIASQTSLMWNFVWVGMY